MAGCRPEEQAHGNAGHEVLPTDPATGACCFIEVKGHLPQTELLSVSRRSLLVAVGII